MAFSINTNVASLQAQNYLQQNSTFQSKTIGQVTSGLRIVNSGDDAAGLAVANGYRSDEAVLTQGIQNANNGLATLQTIDGGMSNISTLLDRARTLATESASGTFTGDRNTVNSEFQSVITEISRQAQSVGMDQGGQFAKALSVFIGGGKGATSAAASANGSVNMDLSKSTVDAQSLGLVGVQAANANSYDLSGSSATSVQNIVTDAVNLGALATANTTQFTFFGAGFANNAAGTNAGITISVNVNGVADGTSLANQINSAIQSAGNGATGAAAAFKNAGITASIVTDSNGNQKLAFSSSNSAFQVKANDLMSSALMGDFSIGSTGSQMGTTVQGRANIAAFASLNFTANQVSLTLKGAGLSSPVNINLSGNDSGGAGALAADIQGQLNAAGASTVTVTAASAGQLSFASTTGAISLYASGNATGLGWLGLTSSGSTAAIAPTAGQAYNTYNANGSSQLGSAGTATALRWGGLAATSGDTQAITISANDASGVAHQTAVTLTSNGSTGSLDTLQLAVAGINKNLQQSNDATLQQITAVAVNDNGQQKITFVSNLKTFSVGIGDSTGNTGAAANQTEGLYTLNSANAVIQGFNSAATQVGAGGTADISTQSGALAAVNTLASSVQALGNAQAAVGKGENLLNYATSLAQSQMTNEAASESAIRDANLAQEAANLTKAQILVQAGTAALAQANSAPQQLLSLLQGH